MTRDALMMASMANYRKYLQTVVYPTMAKYVKTKGRVVEVGVRPRIWGQPGLQGDRGVVSPAIIPHATFTGVDRNSDRSKVVHDVLTTPLKADVILSTCLLHHTRERDVPTVLANLQAPLLLLSGPNKVELPDLFGDHLWHLERGKLERWLLALGYSCVAWEPLGLTLPKCELLVVARR